MDTTDNKRVVQRLVEEGINGNRDETLDELCTPALARRLRDDFKSFRAAFPDWHMEIVQLVAENDNVVARFKCSGTQHGDWFGSRATGRYMRVDEVFVFTIENGRLAKSWSLEDTWSRTEQLAGRGAPSM